VSFTFNNDDSNRTHFGFIAQEVEQIYPHLVNTDSQGSKSVKYSRIIPHTVSSIIEQTKLMKQQKHLIQSNYNIIAELEAENKKLKDKLMAMHIFFCKIASDSKFCHF
jgi:hypothetical protein